MIYLQKYDLSLHLRQSRQTALVSSGNLMTSVIPPISTESWNPEPVEQPRNRANRRESDDPGSEEAFVVSYDPQPSKDSDAVSDLLFPQTDTPYGVFFPQPSLDTWTLDLALLHSLLHFTETSPGTAFGFYELFPNATNHFFSLAMENAGLRHSLLALVGVVRDTFSACGPSEFYLSHKAASLNLLQRAISAGQVDEVLMLAVVMQIGTDSTTGNFPAIRRHTHGLYLIYQHLKDKLGNDGVSPSFGALARVIIRMGARSDHVTARFFDMLPEWPVLTWQDEVQDRAWLTQNMGISKNMALEAIEWALASFEIDNLNHRTYRFAKRSDVYRSSGDPLAETKILSEYQRLVQCLNAWYQRPIVIQQEELERYARLIAEPSHDAQTLFLWHEPLCIQNSYYMKLVQQWRTCWIYASTIAHPFTGPEPQSHKRFSIAVDICRTHASLKMDTVLSAAWEALYYAGLVFGGTRFYPKECEWIMERSRGIAKVFYFLVGPVELMPTNWEKESVEWNSFAKIIQTMER